MKNKKAAKDLEFERERAKFRKQIRELEQENASLSLTLTERNVEIQKADEEIRSLKDCAAASGIHGNVGRRNAETD